MGSVTMSIRVVECGPFGCRLDRGRVDSLEEIHEGFEVVRAEGLRSSYASVVESLDDPDIRYSPPGMNEEQRVVVDDDLD